MLTLVIFGLICAFLWGYIDAKTPGKIVALASGPLAFLIHRHLEARRVRMNELGMKPKRYREYRFYTQSNTWNSIVYAAMQVMQHKYEFCGKQANAVHHWQYPPREDFGCEGIASLIVVCEVCHTALHGKETGNTTECALCRKTLADTELQIDLSKYQLRSQKVCKRCKNIATGHRYKANKMTFSEYKKWVSEWENDLLSFFSKH